MPGKDAEVAEGAVRGGRRRSEAARGGQVTLSLPPLPPCGACSEGEAPAYTRPAPRVEPRTEAEPRLRPGLPGDPIDAQRR